ncbi:MAG: HlyD family efflux transporter periplasmic adaptor subunit, partial [Emcibacter sp.]|nr:HlyD family efflux transporter periplasmic adaptor subunit [Emcibacter sp.]
GVTLVLVKFLHELGHAYSAKRKNCRVPTMGIAFLVMFPMAYTDVNDVWRLSNKRDKFAVGAAGIRVELFIAVWASLSWAMLPDGPLRTSAFLLASTTWVSTIVINASPFLRFDGYFLLMDYLQIPNLHARSFAMARWKLKEWLFCEGKLAPEFFTKGRERFLIIFAWFTWVYRLIMFTGIAILIYMTMPKPLGQILALIELSWFIFMPIYRELKTWFKERKNLLKSGQWMKGAIFFSLVFLLFIIPWDKRVSGQGMLKPSQITQVLTPGDARIQNISISDGDIVKAGDFLFQMETPDLDNEILAAKVRQQMLTWQQQRAGLRDELREQLFVIQAEQGKIAAELSGLINMRRKYTLSAPHDGVYRWITPNINNGDWLAGDTAIAEVLSPKEWQVDTYLTETELDRIRLGDRGIFYPEAGFPASIKLTVSRIDADATRILPDPILSSVYGGSILVREQNNQFIPEIAVFRVTLSPIEDSFPIELGHIRGKISLYGEPRSWISKYLRAAISLFRREASF